MRRQSNTHNQANGHQAATILRTIPLQEIAQPASNTRRTIARKGITELAGSIRQHGVLQPILVSEITPNKAGQAKYQIIAGERRYLAAEQAGLKEIPALVKALSDEAALSAQIVENLQREEVHPLDEADGFLRLKEEMKLDLRTIAQRVAKDTRYVARRLALTSLIAEARTDFRKERITLSHALEICRLAPEIQSEALAACYELKTVWDGEESDNNSSPADKTRPARHVRYLQEWIARNVHLNLKNAPFSLDDPRLREDGLKCLDCPQRSGFNKALFADIKDDVCLNPSCFQSKLQQFVQLKKTELEEKHHKPVMFISAYYGRSTQDSAVISRDQYQLLEKKADRCEFAEPAILADGTGIGQMKWICREESCKDHLGRVVEIREYSSGSVSRTAAPGQHGQRRQELFDVKVDEAVRKHVMQEAIKTFAWPLERQHLNEVAKEFFRRIPSDDQKTICEVFGWNEEMAGRLRYDDAAVLGELAQLDDHRLGQFLMLCSVAHYGANPQRRRPVDQGAVVALSQERGVNHALIDAEVRLELCPKKYKARHQQYLAAIKAGTVADKPLVCERPTPAASSESSEATARKAA